MPTREQLQEAGQHDLIRYINEAGGFLEVRAAQSPFQDFMVFRAEPLQLNA